MILLVISFGKFFCNPSWAVIVLYSTIMTNDECQDNRICLNQTAVLHCNIKNTTNSFKIIRLANAQRMTLGPITQISDCPCNSNIGKYHLPITSYRAHNTTDAKTTDPDEYVVVFFSVYPNSATPSMTHPQACSLTSRYIFEDRCSVDIPITTICNRRCL